MAETTIPEVDPTLAPELAGELARELATTETLFRITMPIAQAAPMLVASPHSGRLYTHDFIASSRLSSDALRRSEDSFVDEVFAGATHAGIPLLQADFPRVYCDVNREAWELDPAMFADKLPGWCNTTSARVAAGFGTIARLVSSGEPIYRNRLTFTEAELRIRTCWQPYHDALAGLIDRTRAKHGACLLLDAHSMPSRAGEPRDGEPRAGKSRTRDTRPDPDFVLGDAFGTSCAQPITQFTERFLRERGFRVRRNDPYAGGYVTRHYGRPSSRIHVLQIEICRSLYMNEQCFEMLPGFAQIQQHITALLAALATAAPALLANP